MKKVFVMLLLCAMAGASFAGGVRGQVISVGTDDWLGSKLFVTLNTNGVKKSYKCVINTESNRHVAASKFMMAMLISAYNTGDLVRLHLHDETGDFTSVRLIEK